MAYESTKLLAIAISQLENPINYESLVSSLKNASFNGPRGLTNLNTELAEQQTKQFICEVRLCDGELINKTIQSIEIPKLCHEQYALAQKNTEKQGWLNPYLIA